jgi:hypothetical protein
MQPPSAPGGAYGGVQLPSPTGGIYSAGGGQLPSANGGIDIGGLITKYGPLALAAYGLLSGAKQSGKADQYLQGAILASQGDFAARQPLRTAGIAHLSALPSPQVIGDRLSNPSNPFDRGSVFPPATLPPSYRLDEEPPPVPLPTVHRLSVGPNGLPLPRSA